MLAERDGGMIAVTLMSSDMGKLYAALAQAVSGVAPSVNRGVGDVDADPAKLVVGDRSAVSRTRPPPPETNASANRTCAARCRLAQDPFRLLSSRVLTPNGAAGKR